MWYKCYLFSSVPTPLTYPFKAPYFPWLLPMMARSHILPLFSGPSSYLPFQDKTFGLPWKKKQSISLRHFEVLHRKCSKTSKRTFSLSTLMRTGSFLHWDWRQLHSWRVGETMSCFWVASWQNIKKLLFYFFIHISSLQPSRLLFLLLLPKARKHCVLSPHLCCRSELILRLLYLRKLLADWRKGACSQRSGRWSYKDWGQPRNTKQSALLFVSNLRFKCLCH